MFKRLLLPLILCVNTGCSVISSQLPEAEPPPVPAWGSMNEKWDLTGLTITAYAPIPNILNYQGQTDDGGISRKSNNNELHNKLELAEEAAFRRARTLVLEELTGVWLKTLSDVSLPQPQATQIREKIDNQLRGIFVNRRFYDAQRRIFHIQVYLSKNSIVSILEKTFNTKVELENQGKVMIALNTHPI